MSSESIVVFLRAQIGEFSAKMKEAGVQAETMGTRSGGAFSRFNRVGTAALIGLGAAAVGFGVMSVKAALEAEKTHAQLATAIKNTGHSYNEYGDEIEHASHKLANLGFTHDEVEQSITIVTRATKDAGKATEQQGLIADVARGRNISLADAAGLVAKMDLGRYTILTKLGIASKEQVKNIHSEKDAMALLSSIYGGAAQANAETLTGKMEVLNAKFHNVQQEVGQALIPVLIGLAEGVMSVFEWFGKVNDASDGLFGHLLLMAGGGAIAVLAIVKLVSGLKALVTAVIEAGRAILIFVARNPALVALLVASAAAVLLLGNNSHEAAIKVSELTDAGLDEYMQKLIDKITDLNSHAIGPKFDKDKEVLKGFNDALKEGLPSAQRYIDAMDRAGLATDEERRILGEHIHAQNEQKAASERVEAATKKDAAATQGNTAAKKSHTEVIAALKAHLENMKVGFDSNYVAIKHNADATEALVNHLKELNEITLASANTELRQEQTVVAVGEAVHTLAEKVDAAKKAKKGDWQATQDLTQAHFGVRSALLEAVGAAQANAEAIDKNRQAHGQNVTSLEIERHKHDAAMLTLAALKGQYPQLSDEIDRYRLTLDLIPRTKHTDVSVTEYRSTVTVAGGRKDRFKAAGGPVVAGGGYWVGEHGAEWFQPTHDGRIIPNRDALRAVVSERRQASNPVMVHAPIHAPVTITGNTGNLSARAIEAAVERAISRAGDSLVRALIAWQRGNIKVTAYLDRAA